MDKLSYKSFGVITIASLVIMAIAFCLLPFSDLKNSLIELSMYIIQIPLYLYARAIFKEPLHAMGLNKCFCITNLHYILIFSTIKLSIILIGHVYASLLVSALTISACYLTSTVSSNADKFGKLFYGARSKYQNLIDFVKFNPSDSELIKYENSIKEQDRFRYYVFTYIFRDRLTWDKVMEKLDIDDRKTLDKEIYAIYAALEYALGLRD